MAALASLRAPVDAFFDKVTVNDPDPAKREARLDLLARVRDAVHRVADFSQDRGLNDPLRLPVRRRRSSDGEAGNKNLLGGKGANLAEMASIGLPVPPGFTISTEMCALYYARRRAPSRGRLRAEVAEGIAHIEQVTGRRFGDAADPLLVSVRSGARVSMPGMMDTVLNLGLNDATVEGLAAASGDPRFAWDSYRRFIHMYANVVLGLDHDLFEEALEIAKEDKGVHLDTELRGRGLAAARRALQGAGRRGAGPAVPARTRTSSCGARSARCSARWQADRAKIYRRLNDIPGDWGTAVNVQAMVFGNMGETSATGVAFTRDPVDRRAGLLWRISDQRPGRGRRRRHPHPAISDPRRARQGRGEGAVDGRDDARGVRRARPRLRPARAPLSRHAGHRVHRRARATCGCCRPAPASAPPRRRSGSPSTWPAKG